MSSAPEARWQTLDAVRATVAYADVFDFAVSRSEVHRDLVGLAASSSEVDAAIHLAILSGDFNSDRGYLHLAGRPGLVDQRLARQQASDSLWSTARAYGSLLAGLPFVRFVGVTGSLAADNATPDADIDFLLVVAPDRLWSVRALAIGVVRLARLRQVNLCPNYLLTSNALRLPYEDLYTAHELLQMVPLAGDNTYRAFRAANQWADRFLPNRARVSRVIPALGGLPARSKPLTEGLLGGSLGTRIDRWEGQRKIGRFRAVGTRGRFTRDVCEGHFGHHRDRVLDGWRQRCVSFGDTLHDRATDVGLIGPPLAASA